MNVVNQSRPTYQVLYKSQIQVPMTKPKSNQTLKKRTVKPRRLELVVPNEPQSESHEKSESQSESEGEKTMAKTEFTEGIFWRPTMSIPNSTVKIKPSRKRPARKLVKPRLA